MHAQASPQSTQYRYVHKIARASNENRTEFPVPHACNDQSLLDPPDPNRKVQHSPYQHSPILYSFRLLYLHEITQLGSSSSADLHSRNKNLLLQYVE